jgi:hypothetical protein
MAVPYAEIERLLEGAGRRKVRIILVTAVGYGVGGVLAALLLGAFALSAGAGDAVRALALAVAAAVALGAGGYAAWATVKGALGQAAAARTVGAAEPRLRSDLLSSVELQNQYGDIAGTQRFSLALVDALIERTAERSMGIDLGRVIPAKPAMRATASLLAVLAVNLLAMAVGGKGLAAGYGKLLSGRHAGAGGGVAALDPITGDIEITYLYPSYMGRPARTLSGTGGEVSAPKGTEVRLKTRADRDVDQAELAVEMGQGKTGAKKFAVEVKDRRSLAASFVVEEGGSYRFRYLKGARSVAEGPPIPVVVEPDLFPEVKITAPQGEVEVDAKAHVRIDWTASDDYGLQDLNIVLKPPLGEEQRRELKTFGTGRRESGSYDLEIASLKMGEGEKLLYYLEVRDNDAVSGPKRGASQTQAVKIYSEAEHHRQVMEKAQALWEKLVGLLGDRLEFEARRGDGGWTVDRLATADAFDARTRHLHEEMRVVALAIKKDPATPREVPAALLNVSAGIRELEQRLTGVRGGLSRMMRVGRGADPVFSARVNELEGELTREMEKDILYLEDLFDKRKAMDLVALAKEVAARRRDLAALLEKYKSAPDEKAKKELLAEVSRMKQRMMDLMKRMADLAKGIDDEHMNAEALAEMKKSKDMMNQLDDVEKMLAKGDIDGAMKALDQMGNQMQEMLSQLEKTAGEPDKKRAELAKEMKQFEEELKGVQNEQERLAEETEKVKGEYKRKIAERLKASEQIVNKLRALTEEARKKVADIDKAAPLRAGTDNEWNDAKERLDDLDRALAVKDFDAALETTHRAMPKLQGLAQDLNDEAEAAERYPSLMQKNTEALREALQNAKGAIPPVAQVREELMKLFPDPKSVLGKDQQAALQKMAQRQGQLQQRAGGMQQKLEQLMQKAPIFPQGAGEMAGNAKQHMGQAAGELGNKNPQRGAGQQRMALDELGKLRRGLEEMAKNAQKSGGQGGFPMPFAESGSGQEEGSDGELSPQKVEIPGADAYKVPEEFRKDLLEAMKQGSPEVYKGEVQRYYEEIVK